MLSDLQLVYMVPRNSIQLLKINITKFQVEREPVYAKGGDFKKGALDSDFMFVDIEPYKSKKCVPY